MWRVNHKRLKSWLNFNLHFDFDLNLIFRLNFVFSKILFVLIKLILLEFSLTSNSKTTVCNKWNRNLHAHKLFPQAFTECYSVFYAFSWQIRAVLKYENNLHLHFYTLWSYFYQSVLWNVEINFCFEQKLSFQKMGERL